MDATLMGIYWPLVIVLFELLLFGFLVAFVRRIVNDPHPAEEEMVDWVVEHPENEAPSVPAVAAQQRFEHDVEERMPSAV